VKHRRFLLGAFLALISTGAIAQASLEFAPSEWKFGMITKGEIARLRLAVTNRGTSSEIVSLLPTCSCLKVDPPSCEIAAGASAYFDLAYDSKDDDGKVERAFIVKTGKAQDKAVYYFLRGVSRADNGYSASGQVAPGGSEASLGSIDGSLELRYYYTPGCRSCEAFLSSEIPRLEAAYGLKIRTLRRDLLDPASYEEYVQAARELGVDLKSIPALRFGAVLLQGDEEIESRLPGLLAASRGSPQSYESAVTPAPPARLAISGISLSALPVMAAGLVDGINPCAFTTLIFLLASLALAGRGRREVLAIGAFFTLGVFLTYLGIGFGLFAALRAAQAVALVGIVLHWVLFAVLVVFAALSVYDYTRIRRGRSSEIILQLPKSLKLRIHASIRTRAKTAALAGSSFVLGFLISIFEFACTGQVYLPTLAYLARERGGSRAVLLLVLYNLCFIAPLVAVFIASYLGVSSKRIATAFQKRMGAVKLGLAVVFALLAVLTVSF
jgi:cytochrome c biogenesis protein CcdA